LLQEKLCSVDIKQHSLTQHFSYIVAVSISGGNCWKPQTN